MGSSRSTPISVWRKLVVSAPQENHRSRWIADVVGLGNKEIISGKRYARFRFLSSFPLFSSFSMVLTAYDMESHLGRIYTYELIIIEAKKTKGRRKNSRLNNDENHRKMAGPCHAVLSA